MILLCIKTEVLRPIKDDDDDDDDDVDRFEHLPEPGFLRAEKLCHRIFPQYFAADDVDKHEYSAADDDDKHQYFAHKKIWTFPQQTSSKSWRMR